MRAAGHEGLQAEAEAGARGWRPWARAVLAYLLVAFLPFAWGLLGFAHQDGSAALWGHDLAFPPTTSLPHNPNQDWSPGLVQQSWDAWAMQQWRQGEWPLWQPYSALGGPLWSNGQSGVLNPLKWLLVWGQEGPAYLCFLWVRLVVGGLGALALAARVGQRPLAAFLAATLWSWSAPMALHFTFPDLHAIVFMPWLAWLGLALLASPGWAQASALGCLAGLTAWMGHVEGAFFAGLGGVAVWGAVWWRGPNQGWALLWALVALVWAILVAAPIWWPFLDHMAASVSYHQDPNGFRAYMRQLTPLTGVLTLLVKLAFWPWAAQQTAWFNAYITTVGVVLAGLGATRAGGGRLVALGLLGGFVACLLLFQPTSPWVLPLSPLSFYASPLASLGLALLAGEGLLRVQEGLGRKGRWALVLGALAISVLAARGAWQAPVAALWYAQGFPVSGLNAWPMLAFPAALALAGWAAWPRAHALGWVAPAFVGAALAEGLVYMAIACPALPVGGYPWPRHWPPQAALTGARLGGHDGHYFAPNLGFAYGLRQFDVLDAWIPKRFQAFAAVANPEGPPSLNVMLAGRGEGAHGGLLDLASVTHALGPDAQGQWGPQPRPRALPRARWLDQAVLHPGPWAEAGQRLLAEPERWRRTLLLEAPAQSSWGAWAKPLPAGESAQLRWLEDRPNRLAWRVQSPTPGWLVVADQHATGWRAEVDGQVAPILPAYVAMRAVPVPAGEHTVRMRYWPEHLTQALALAALGLFSALALWLQAWLRGRRLAP